MSDCDAVVENQKFVYTKVELKTIRQEMGPIAFPEELLEHGQGKIVATPVRNTSSSSNAVTQENARRTKKDDTNRDKRGGLGDKSTNNTSSTSTTGGITTETISPTNWRKVKHDFTEVVPKSTSKKNRDHKDKDADSKSDKRTGSNNANKNYADNNNSNRKNAKNDSGSGGRGSRGGGHVEVSNKQKSDSSSTTGPSKTRPVEEDLWDMPTGLSSEESAGLSEREMFELERKKFLALRSQPTAASKEGQYHTESDTILSSMQIEQAQLDDAKNTEVAGNTFDFQAKSSKSQPGSESRIRSLTASDVMTGSHGGNSSEDMAWLGAMLGGGGGRTGGIELDPERDDTSRGLRSASTSGISEGQSDQDFFSRFLSAPLPLSLSPSSSSGGVLEGAGTGATGSDDSGGGQVQSKSSRLGSLLGIPLSPPSSSTPNTAPPPPSSGIQEMSFSLEDMGGGGYDGRGQGQSAGEGPTVQNQNQSQNQKSRDLLATLGFSPPRQPAPPRFAAPPGSHMNHNMINSNITVHNVNPVSAGPGARFVFQEQQQPPQPPSASPAATPNKPSTPKLTPSGSDSGSGNKTPPPASSTTSTPGGGGKRASMSASSRLQLARMKQQSGGGKKRIEVASLFSKAPPPTSSSSSTSTSGGAAASAITTSSTAPVLLPVPVPVPVPNSTTQTASSTPPTPPTTTTPPVSSAPKVTTNSKGASLLMKLKK